jgi:hypothetical protein
MLQLYRRSPLWGAALPTIAAIYTAFTIESAIQHWRGRGGAWKGRYQAHGRAGSTSLASDESTANGERSDASFGALRA